ncbi:rod shape-determining protein MreD [Lacticaseibacillus brantae]|uniref:Rod shape-determining protein MreD n=1 Tax=Lacticaseibacillus brantae DSM 23927 TaxID=1423727 RepID=A0A0R2AYS7_9LACO|nr:rod shape-determining protein MreD [Lacticaseibacillus brantae]KRM72494.1 rod shape-determining protein MreD [Lacticaseibacillus brantae DSM 23927]
MQLERTFKKHWVAPLILFIALVLDGALTQLLEQWTMTPTFTAPSQLTLLALMMIVIFLPNENWIMGYAVLTGLVYDSFYTGILGVSTLLMPLVVYLIEQIRPYILRSPVFVGIVAVITLTVFEFANYIMNQVLGFANVGLAAMIANHLGPGLILNLVLLFIGYWPMSRLLLKLNKV